MEYLGKWVLSAAGAAILTAAAEALMPPGGVKEVGRILCGLVLAVVVAAPVARIDPQAGLAWLERYDIAVEEHRICLAQEVSQGLSEVIAEQTAAYITDKAADLSLDCRVEVLCDENEQGLPFPVRVLVYGIAEGTGKDALSRLIREDLGIPVEEQSFLPEEAGP